MESAVPVGTRSGRGSSAARANVSSMGLFGRRGGRGTPDGDGDDLADVRPMDLDRFWAVVEGAGTPSALHDRLEALPRRDLVGFERRHDRLTREAYDWGLWGAAYVLHGGCGDDAFADFRAYLVSRGRAVFEAALADPDALADVEGLDAEGEEWEDWSSPTMAVVHRRTGEYDLAGPPDPDAPAWGEPSGEEWDEDAGDLARRFPRLTARYG